MLRTRRSSEFSYASSTSSSSASNSPTSSRHGNSSSSSSSSSSDMDDDEEEYGSTAAVATKRRSRRDRKRRRTLSAATAAAAASVAKTSTALQQQGPQNIIVKLLQRERTGFLSSRPRIRCNQQKFSAVPRGLSFCLKDIVPFCYLTGHVFMGLTVCGQFLLSYKVTVIDTNDFDQFSIGSYKYELYMWIYRPHQLLRKFYSRPLFDDHGADNEVTVTMCQWMDTPRTLIVHGSSKYENEDSYVSVMAVPRLGCLSCRRLRDAGIGADNRPFETSARSAMLCIACNLTVHTKYTRSESDPPFEPRINLNCPERVILFTNGLIHMLHVGVDIQATSPTQTLRTACLNERYVRRKDEPIVDEKSARAGLQRRPFEPKPTASLPAAAVVVPLSSILPQPVSQKPADIVAQIIADFDDFESASCSTASSSPTTSAPIENASSDGTVRAPMTTKFFEELVINTIPSSGAPRAVAELRRPATNNNSLRWIARLAAVASPPKADASTTRNTATANEPANATSTATTTNAYDFADEPPERYEKISSFRKRRLADKKYEFSEDNSENIIPFAKLRMRRQNLLHTAIGDSIGGPHSSSHAVMRSPSPATPALYGTADAATPVAVAAAAAAAASAQQSQPPHTHRASPSHGFRSPCGSPVGGNRFSIMSPPMMSHRPLAAAVSAAPTTASSSGAGLTGGGIIAAGSTAGLFGRSPTYKPFGSSPRYMKRIESVNGELGGTAIYSPMLLSPRSDAEFEAYRVVGTAAAALLPPSPQQPMSSSSNNGLPLAEVKPSNIFNHSSSAAAIGSPLASAEPPTKDIAAAMAATASASAAPSSHSATNAAATSPARTICDDEASVSSATATTTTTTTTTTTPSLLCAKQLLRRYVSAPPPPATSPHTGDNNSSDDQPDADDDRCSVMTEDDDCISPGYHTSLPVEVHGACYATLQSVSASVLQQRRQAQAPHAKTAVLVAQHTFDLEMLTYHIANQLCVLHGKQYGSFYDWACEPIHICPLSGLLVSLLLVKFTARDATPPGAEPCLNCANGDRLDCAFHRRHFEGRSLFTWNVQTGAWSVIDYGDLAEQPSSVPKRRSADAPMHSAHAHGNTASSGNGIGGASAAAGSSTGVGGNGSGGSATTASTASDLMNAQDLTACARRLANEMRAAVTPLFGGAAGAVACDRKRRSGTRISVASSRSVDVDVSWTMAGLHTLDSCTERSKEFLRDQYNAIEFVRGATSDSCVSGLDISSSSSIGTLVLVNGTPTLAVYDLSSSSDNSDWE